MTEPTRFVSNAAAIARRAGVLGLIAAFAFALAPTHGALAQSDPVVAKVNGTEVKQSDLTAAEEEIGQQIASMPAEAKREYLITYVADMILISRAAESKKIGDTPEFRKKLALLRTKLLMEVFLEQEAKAAVTDAAMRKVYDDAVKQMGSEQEVRARHILVESEDEAKKLSSELKKGGDFAAAAKDKSKDPGSAAQGGDLGYFTKDQMVAEFSEVAFKLNKDQVSDPVKTQFGWHVIKVEDKRNKPVPPFEQVKDQIETYVVRKAQAESVQKLREGAKIERMDKPAEQKK
jgi:peptidyl-prolyl cis-trans isomerase C